HYAAIVLEKAMLRPLIAAGGAITSLGYEGGDDVAELVDRAEQAVFAIGARRQHQDAQAIREILKIQFREHRLPVPGEGARDRGGDGLQRPGPPDGRVAGGGHDHRGGPAGDGEDDVGAGRGAARGGSTCRWRCSAWRRAASSWWRGCCARKPG